MNVLIKSATIIDSKSDFNNKKNDILIEKGIITNISKQIKNPKNYKEIRLDNLHISQGKQPHFYNLRSCIGFLPKCM